MSDLGRFRQMLLGNEKFVKALQFTIWNSSFDFDDDINCQLEPALLDIFARILADEMTVDEMGECLTTKFKTEQAIDSTSKQCQLAKCILIGFREVRLHLTSA